MSPWQRCLQIELIALIVLGAEEQIRKHLPTKLFANLKIN